MKQKPKYMRRVFSGKDVPVIGLDQGKSKLYRGDGVNYLMNCFYDASLDSRDGQVVDVTFSGGINTGVQLHVSRVIGEGTNLRAELI